MCWLPATRSGNQPAKWLKSNNVFLFLHVVMIWGLQATVDVSSMLTCRHICWTCWCLWVNACAHMCTVRGELCSWFHCTNTQRFYNYMITDFLYNICIFDYHGKYRRNAHPPFPGHVKTCKHQRRSETCKNHFLCVTRTWIYRHAKGIAIGIGMCLISGELHVAIPCLSYGFVFGLFWLH